MYCILFEEMAELEAAKKRHGSYKAAIMAGLRKDAGVNDLTKQDVVNWIERNVK